MKNGKTPVFNERAWGIQIISEINRLVSDKSVNYCVKCAGGEFGTAQEGASTLFPDVLLFGDVSKRLIIQGWELKTPETDIADVKLLANAKEKARRMDTRSFLVWNGRVAVLYVLDPDEEWRESCRWIDPAITSRETLDRMPEVWKSTLQSIILKIEELVSKGPILSAARTTDQLDSLVTAVLNATQNPIEESLHKQYVSNGKFRASLDAWWMSVRGEHPDIKAPSEDAAVSVKATETAYHWALRILFVHYMKTFEHDAWNVDNFDDATSPSEFDKFCDELSAKHDFALMLRARTDLQTVPDAAWREFAAFNKLLSSVHIASLSQPELHSIVQQLQSRYRMKALGQFPTPKRLADLLARIVLNDVENDVVIDPCCGTGTLSRAIMDERRRLGVSEELCYRNTWASDRFTAPLQFATLALSSGNNLDEVIRLFCKDALSLTVGEEISFTNPRTGALVKEKLPRFSAIVVNPPFIRFEHWKDNYAGDTGMISSALALAKDAKADFLVPIVLHLANLLLPNGTLGVVLPNAWLGAGWARTFRQELSRRFDFEYVIGSMNGRWFEDAKIVTNLVVLRKREGDDHSKLDCADGSVTFALTEKPIAQWADDYLGEIVAGIVANSTAFNGFSLKRQSSEIIHTVDELGLAWTACFAPLDWLAEIRTKFVPVTDFFAIARGERRGWDKMFYPGIEAAATIEKRFLAPVIKTASEVTELIAQADSVAFCCNEPIEVLRREKCVGALAWIERFEREVNNTGRPLPDVLARSGQQWYEMSASTRADIAVSMNPGERLFFMRMREPTFVNQRLIRLTKRNDTVDVELCHALLCSMVSCFFLEALGFGRGEGVLDLSATKLKDSLLMLNPQQLSKSHVRTIKKAFVKLASRPVKTFEEEFCSKDRLAFERAVLKAYDCESLYTPILTAVKTLHNLRLAPVR
ncbi:MAG: N-6 DNA methylase [Kiritimatiellae bacterium]|nr:N-6 DNA methylase [Kiritimatiellia bacterium]